MRIQLCALLLGACGILSAAEPRYIRNLEEVQPLLQQYARDPFRYPGIWSADAGDPFGSDLQAMRAPLGAMPPPPPLPPLPTIGGIRPSTPAFLAKIPYLAPEETLRSYSGEDAPAERFAPEEEGAAAAEPRYLRPYLITTAPFLASVGLRGKVFPGECRLRYRSANESEVLQSFEEIELEVSGEGVQPGDFFKVYEVGDRQQSFRDRRDLGRLVQIRGLAEVQRVGKGYAVAKLVRCFGTVSRRSRAAPLGELPAVRTRGYAPVSGNPRIGRVVWVTPPHQIPQPFSQAIIDGGSRDGFGVGDFLIILDRKNGRMTDKVLGNAVVLRAEETSSTLLLQDVHPGVINAGDFAVAHLSPTP